MYLALWLTYYLLGSSALISSVPWFKFANTTHKSHAKLKDRHQRWERELRRSLKIKYGYVVLKRNII